MNLILRLLTVSLVLLMAFSCATQKLDVVCACEEGAKDYDTIKWEAFPQNDGLVEVFASSSPDSFEESEPLATARIPDRIVRVPKQDGNRKYFMLVFNKEQKVFVTNRKINVPGVANFRDAGGYITASGGHLRWGKIYRSASLSAISPEGIARIKELKIKTIIDLCTPEERANHPEPDMGIKRISIPVDLPFDERMRHRLLERKCKRTDAVIHMQDIFAEFTRNYNREFARLFEALSHEENYPVLIHGSNGNDRTGFTVALIMKSLNIRDEDIMEDYLFSNTCSDIRREATFASELPTDEQEALTVFVSAQRSFLEYAFRKITEDNGSFTHYFEKKLNLDRQKRENMQQILLTR